MTGFSGSYRPEDVTFLLTQVSLSGTSVEQKELFIKNGGHYSEVLTLEQAPSAEYMAIYRQVMAANKRRFASDVRALAEMIRASLPAGVAPVVVSLARAGTPVGVLVARELREAGLEANHYCVSIIRDKGLDLNALRWLVAKHGDAGIRFVDGWTGKGVIGAELANSVRQFNQGAGTAVSEALYVVADIAGTAAVAATRDDYLLPSAVLNSTVSGLVSRTVLTPDLGANAFHGCLVYEHLAPADISQAFVDEVWAAMREPGAETWPAGPAQASAASNLRDVVARYQAAYGLASRNLVKPGIGEATRVLLRRKPLVLVVRDAPSAQTQHLHHLASEKRIPVIQDETLPCQALALIDQAD